MTSKKSPEPDMLQAHELSRDIIVTLLENTEAERGMTVSQIVTVLEKKHRASGTPKTVRRHLESLHELKPFGLGIEHGGDSSRWRVVPIFETSQLRLLADGLLELRLDTEETRSIIEKLHELAGKKLGASIDFLQGQDVVRRTSHNYLRNVATLDNAIARGCAVEYQRNRWNTKGELVVRKYQGEPLRFVCYPYQMTVKGGTRYLIFKPEKERFLDYIAVNMIHDVKLLPKIPAPPITSILYEGGELNLARWQDEKLGYRTTVWPRPARHFSVRIFSLDTLFDTFPHAKAKAVKGGGYIAEFDANPDQVVQWAMQPLNRAEVLEPPEERNHIRILAKSLYEQYSSGTE